MLIRKITESDIPFGTKIYDGAREFMRDAGNPDQWQPGSPGRESLLDDMNHGRGYVCEDGGRIVAVFAFEIGREPDYDKIYNGSWRSGQPYAYIHRIAVAEHGRGIVDFCFNWCAEQHPHLRIDTHRDNIPMQRVLERNRFLQCGVVYVRNGEERLAYERTDKI